VGTNGILECEFLSENAHRAVKNCTNKEEFVSVLLIVGQLRGQCIVWNVCHRVAQEEDDVKGTKPRGNAFSVAVYMYSPTG
jgi:hypothetical protein